MKILAIIIPVFLISGCAGKSTALPRLKAGGLYRYHTVKRGETLWRISKRYNLAMEDLIKANRITNPRQIKTGQMLFLPEVSDIKKQQGRTIASAGFQDFIWPLKGKVISGFGQIRNKVNNKGIDIQVGVDSDIRASRSGTVAFIADDLHGWGRTMIIDHSDGFKTVYSGVSEVNIKTGDKVRRGDKIAGITSLANRLSCLHFEIRKGHEPKNPLYYLP